MNARQRREDAERILRWLVEDDARWDRSRMVWRWLGPIGFVSLVAGGVMAAALLVGCAPRDGLTPEQARTEIHADAERMWCQPGVLKPHWREELCL